MQYQWFYRRRKSASLLALERLADCLSVGIDLTQSVQFLARHSRGSQANLFVSILAEVDQGRPLSPALRPYVDRGTIAMFGIAEKVGVLPSAIREFVKRERENQLLQARLIRAVAYPFGLLLGCMALVVFVQLRVQPELRLLSATLHPKSDAMQSVWAELAVFFPWFICALFVLLPMMGISVYLLRKFTGRRIMPLPFDRLLKNIESEQFVYSLAVQLQAGLTFMDSFDVGLDSSTGRRREFYQHARKKVLEGHPLSQSLHSRLAPIVKDMVAHGELTGEVEKSLSQARRLLQENNYRTMEQAMRLLEPILMFVMGMVVLASMYSVFSPMYAAITSTVST